MKTTHSRNPAPLTQEPPTRISKVTVLHYRNPTQTTAPATKPMGTLPFRVSKALRRMGGKRYWIICKMSRRSGEIIGAALHRNTSRQLEAIDATIGDKQVTASHLLFAPPWILHDSLKTEHESNWKDAYIEVQDRNIPRNANVISSHVVYKLKTDELGTSRLKSRIVPHGNCSTIPYHSPPGRR